MSSPAVSVIVTARRPTNNLPHCLAALRQQSDDILIAGAITAAQQAQISDIPILADSDNPIAARNQAILQAQGGVLAFIDADCTPTAGWLDALKESLTSAETIGSKGSYATHQTALVPRFAQLEYEEKYARLAKQPRIDFIDTYSAAYRRHILLANNCFDPQFPHLEDQELSFRLAARGYKLVFAPDAVVTHTHPPTIRAYFGNKFRIGFWKAEVVRRFPGQGIRDSHTPQIIKIQLLLLAALLLALPLALLLPAARIGALVAFGLLLGSMGPFMGHALRRDKAVAMVAPPLLMVRALALGLGYAWGLARPRRHITHRHTGISGRNYIRKRGLDLVGSLAGLSILCLLGPAIALAIKLTSKGPIIFRQERIGQGGKPFTVYKFRSMQADAEQQLDQLIDIDTLSQPAFKLENDPRITAVGRRLRRWSLDELPQFWNVFKGDMSLVGPRPEETRIVARYSDWHRRRLAVKPGISGPMQVGGRGDLPLDERVRLEIEYIENYSLWRDIQILWRTLPAVAHGDGAR